MDELFIYFLTLEFISLVCDHHELKYICYFIKNNIFIVYQIFWMVTFFWKPLFILELNIHHVSRVLPRLCSAWSQRIRSRSLVQASFTSRLKAWSVYVSWVFRFRNQISKQRPVSPVFWVMPTSDVCVQTPGSLVLIIWGGWVSPLDWTCSLPLLAVCHNKGNTAFVDGAAMCVF